MTTKLAQDGDTLTISLPANATVDNFYAIGVTGTSLGLAVGNGLPAVATNTGTTGTSIAFMVEGVFTLSKKDEANSSLVAGQKVFWRTTGGVNELTGLATAADGVAGVAWAAAATGDTTATIKLLGFGNYAAI